MNLTREPGPERDPAPLVGLLASMAPDDAGVDEEPLADKIRALQLPCTYPVTVTVIESIETHFAWVFLVGDYAFKLKKPVALPGMDLRQLLARRSSCEEELRLNRRLAPDVYLDVVPLVRGADRSLHVGGGGVVVDWLVRMRRLPTSAMLDRAICDRAVPRSALAAIGVKLAWFYRTQPRVTFALDEYVARIAAQIQADRRALLEPELQLDSHHVSAAITATWCAFSALETQLAQRAREDRVVEAHGDLRPEHICLIEPPCVIDSLEFSRDLRTLDPAEELAFLWIECEQAGDVQAASVVLESYRRESRDLVSDRLLDFYRARRALVRAKIVAWHLRDPTVMHLAPWRDRAEGYVAMAERYARRATGDDACDGLDEDR